MPSCHTGGISIAEDEKVKTYHLIDAAGHTYESETPGTLGGYRRGAKRIYGRLDCASAVRHLAKGHYAAHRVFFKDEETAIAAGFRPCGVCMREAYLAWKRCACPQCGSTDSVEVVYGLPTEIAFEAERRGEIALGGCMPELENRRCKECGRRFRHNA